MAHLMSRRGGIYTTDENFANWAFGEDLWAEFLISHAEPIDLLIAWNRRHGDLLLVEEDDLIIESMEKMKKLWEEYGDIAP